MPVDAVPDPTAGSEDVETELSGVSVSSVASSDEDDEEVVVSAVVVPGRTWTVGAVSVDCVGFGGLDAVGGTVVAVCGSFRTGWPDGTG